MIDLLLEHGGERSREQHFLQELSAHVAAVNASAGGGDRAQVSAIEAEVRVRPEDSFIFDAEGAGTLRTAQWTFAAGRFETPSIGALRQRAAAAVRAGTQGHVRLWVLDGESPATDIGSLQATAGPRTLFQVASQFNCLEAPGPSIVPIARYFGDPTQGPRVTEVMDVVVNGRNLGERLSHEEILPAVRARGGAVVVFGPAGVSVRR